jgi:hypothetical protein
MEAKEEVGGFYLGDEQNWDTGKITYPNHMHTQERRESLVRGSFPRRCRAMTVYTRRDRSTGRLS